jgi:ABC-type amino acid transport substrate-binding protein
MSEQSRRHPRFRRYFTATGLHRLLAAILLICICSVPSHGQSEVGTKKIIVGTMRVPPFVLRSDDGQWSGLSIDLWKQIASDLNIAFEFREFDYNIAGLLDAVERRQIDAAIAAIPITLEGEARFDFTHPYYSAGLGIAARTESQRGIAGILSGFLSYQALAAVGALLGLLVAVDPRPLPGIADGVWWAAVTMTTTGYGDKVPSSWPGRAFALIWMFASIFCITLFSATLASSFVVGRLTTGVNGPGDLPRVRVAAVSGTAGEQWLNALQMPVRTYPFVIQASKALQRGEVQALVYERAIIGHMIKEYGWRDLKLLPHILAVREYAIALPADSAIREPINRALLKSIHSQEWKNLVQRYVGGNDQDGSPDKP